MRVVKLSIHLRIETQWGKLMREEEPGASALPSLSCTCSDCAFQPKSFFSDLANSHKILVRSRPPTGTAEPSPENFLLWGWKLPTVGVKKATVRIKKEETSLVRSLSRRLCRSDSNPGLRFANMRMSVYRLTSLCDTRQLRHRLVQLPGLSSSVFTSGCSGRRI